MKLISVVIPAYNSGKYIRACLESILNQGNYNYEIIIIDDGCVDNTIDIIKEYQEKYVNIKLFKNEGKGVSCARNTGIKFSNGKYIIFIDSDDEIENNLFKTIYPYLEKDIDCIKYNAKYVGGRFDPNDDRFETTSFENLLGQEALARFCKEQKIFATPWMYAIKKQVYVDNNLVFPVDRVHEDVAVMPLAVCFSNSVCSLDFVGYKYIQHTESIMNDRSYNKKLERAYDFLYCYDYLHSKIDNFKILDKNKKIFYDYLSKRINCKIEHLVGEDQKKFIMELQKREVNKWINDNKTIADKYR